MKPGGYFSTIASDSAEVMRRKFAATPVRLPEPIAQLTTVGTGGTGSGASYGCCASCIPSDYMTIRNRYARIYYAANLPTTLTESDSTTSLGIVTFNYSGVSGDDIASITGISDGLLIYESDAITYTCAEGYEDQYYYILAIDPNDCLAASYSDPPNSAIYIVHDGTATVCPNLTLSCTDTGDTGACPSQATNQTFSGTFGGIGSFAMTHSSGCTWTATVGGVTLTWDVTSGVINANDGVCNIDYSFSGISQVGNLTLSGTLTGGAGNGCGWPDSFSFTGSIVDGAGTLHGPIYRNFGNDFRARCGTKMGIAAPQTMAERLEEVLQCEVCVYPKVNYITSECLVSLATAASRTARWPEYLFLEIVSGELIGSTVYEAKTLTPQTIPLIWTDIGDDPNDNRYCGSSVWAAQADADGPGDFFVEAVTKGTAPNDPTDLYLRALVSCGAQCTGSSPGDCADFTGGNDARFHIEIGASALNEFPQVSGTADDYDGTVPVGCENSLIALQYSCHNAGDVLNADGLIDYTFTVGLWQYACESMNTPIELGSITFRLYEVAT